MAFLCPDCKHEVETIKACGCRDHFCNHCNLLVSRSKVIDTELLNQAPLTPASSVEPN